LCIEATTPEQWLAYTSKFRASASLQLITVVAPKKLQLNRFLDNQFGARSSKNGSLETLKAFVIKKNCQFHYPPPTVKKWHRDKEIQEVVVSKVRFRGPAKSSPSTHCAVTR
jgi:hypothetical protein